MLAEQLLFESAPQIIMVCDVVASWSLRPWLIYNQVSLMISTQDPLWSSWQGRYLCP